MATDHKCAAFTLWGEYDKWLSHVEERLRNSGKKVHKAQFTVFNSIVLVYCVVDEYTTM